MISALCRSKRFEEAKELAKDSETTYEKCDLVMLNTMLCAYCRAGKMESVMRMMKKMDEQAVSVGEIVRVEVNHQVGENLKSDEEIISAIRKKSSVDESIKFVEKRVENAAVDVRSAIEEVRRSNLFLVGRMPGGEIALAIRENSECPELGPVGSLLISPESSTRASVLVIQQYNGNGAAPDLASATAELLTSSPEKNSE